MNLALLNGHPKCTLIEAFNGDVIILRPGFKKECKNLKEAIKFIGQKGWETNVEIIKGSPILRNLTKD